MRKLLLSFFLLFIGVAFIFWSLKKANLEEVAFSFSYLNLWQVSFVLILALLSYLFNVWQWQVVLNKISGFNLSFFKLFKIWLAGWSLNFLTPVALVGGEVAMLGGLKNYFPKIPYRESLSSLILIRVLSFTLALAFVFIGILFLLFHKIFLVPDFVLTFLAVSFLFLLLFYYLVFSRTKILTPLLSFIEKSFKLKNNSLKEIENKVFLFFNSKKFLALALFLGFLSNIFNLLRILALFFFLTFKIPTLGQLFVFLAFLHLAYFLAPPAGLGSLEFFEGLAFSAFGFSQAKALAFSLIFRASELFWVVFGLASFSLIWLALNKKIIKEDYEQSGDS